MDSDTPKTLIEHFSILEDPPTPNKCRRTLLDAYAYAMVRWLRKLEGGVTPWPRLAAFLGRMEEDPGVRRALERAEGRA